MAEQSSHGGVTYGDDQIQTLEWNEHIRRRSGMYIGRLGDGSDLDDGIYMLLKEVIDNSVDEFTSGYGKEIVVDVDETTASVRDYGRGIPLGSVIKAVSTLNTGARFDDSVYQNTIGLNGVGTKAVNAMSTDFFVCAYRGGRCSWARFSKGVLLEDGQGPTSEKDGTFVRFTPDPSLFVGYSFRMEFVEKMVRNYSYVKAGLKLTLNGTQYLSQNGLVDLVNESLTSAALYPPIHLIGKNIDIVLTHTEGGEANVTSFANGQYTYEGGTHLAAYKEAVAKTLMDFFKKNYTAEDCRAGIVGAICIQLQAPLFDSQKKSKMSSNHMWEKDGVPGPTVRSFVNDFLAKELNNYLYIHKDVAAAMEARIKEAQKEREEINQIRSSNRKSRSAACYNENLRDCRYHYCDKPTKNNEGFIEKTSIFITEGKSASGTVTKARDANYQAVFSIRGKSKNSYQSSDSKVLENVELRNLVGALGIQDSLEGLRYNKVIIATDADDDGMHIRLLLMTFFLKYYRELVLGGHLFILETPLFRVKSKRGNRYCYDTAEKAAAIAECEKMGIKEKDVQITRFKGLGEINEKEFENFIGDQMRADQVEIGHGEDVHELLSFYMGSNTMERQQFIIDNLRTEEDLEGTDI